MGESSFPPPRRSSGVPPVGARTPGLEDLSDPDGIERDDEWDDDWDDREPNFLVRRVVAIGAVLAVLVGGGVLVGRVLSGDDESTATAADADWNSLAIVLSDEILLFDAGASVDEGEIAEPADTFDPRLDPTDGEVVQLDEWLLTLGDDGRLLITDLRDGTSSIERFEAGSIISRGTTRTDLAVIGSVGGGEASIVRPASGSVIELGAAAGLSAPLIFAESVRVNPAGTHAAISDANTFQSAVIDLENGTAELLAGQAVALDDDQIVTSLRAGDETELEFFDLAGERIGSIDVPTPVSVVTTDPGRALVFDSDGTVRRVDADGGDIQDLGPIMVEDSGESDDESADTSVPAEPLVGVELGDVFAAVAVRSGDGVLVLGDSRLAFLEDDGSVIAVVEGEIGSPVQHGVECVVTGGLRSRADVVTWNLRTGEALAGAQTVQILTTTPDGCAAVIERSGQRQILGPDGSATDLISDRIVGLAPDASSYAAIEDRTVSLVDVDPEAEEPDAVPLLDRVGTATVYFFER
ncbi:MAG: hypothetical protein AAGD33_22565 [Actinomycetota bacterium]